MYTDGRGGDQETSNGAYEIIGITIQFVRVTVAIDLVIIRTRRM